MSNLSFEQIRLAMTTGVAAAPSMVVSKTKKAVEAVGSFVGGVLPVTNSKLDDRTEAILGLLVATQMDLHDLRVQMNAPLGDDVFVGNRLQDTVSLYMQMIKKGPEKEEAPAKHSDPAPTTEGINQRLNTFLHGTKEELVAEFGAPASVAPVKEEETIPLAKMSISMDKPANWHQI